VAILLVTASVAEASPGDLITRARQFYNRRLVDAAIDTAREAARQPATFQSAQVILSHALLERHRRTGSVDDLAAAHDALVAIDPAALTATEGSEFVVAWGEWHFLDGRPGVAAELFDAALASPGLNTPVSRDRILDWWAQSLERLARDEQPAGRQLLYVRILVKMEQESQRTPRSAVVPYWLAAAARGSGDLDRAWDAAIAGWIRATLAPDGGLALRTDLDRLVSRAIIPERARRLAPADEDVQRIESDMRAEWDVTRRLK
jgi:hypothetical protein